MEPDTLSLVEEHESQLDATALDTQGKPLSGYDIEWMSGDTTVAVVSGDGTVHARDSGRTAVTAHATKEGVDPLSNRAEVVVSPTPTGRAEVSVSTSGDDPDSDGYTVTVNESNSQDVGPNGSATFLGLVEKEHDVELSGIASNCSVEDSNPRTVSVTAGNTAQTSFSVSCTSTTGRLDVSTSTSGDDLDSDGYRVTVDDSSSKELAVNGSVAFSALNAGDHKVELTDIQSNCVVDGSNPRTVLVTAGNNASTAFSVSCDPSFGFRNAVLWEYEEWSVENVSYSGNPFDLIATVTFEHQGSGKSHTTEMFYDGDDTWKFRFTGTRTGTWTFTTSSDDPELDGLSGTVDVSSNPDDYGFIRNDGSKWARQTENGLEAWTPVFRMSFDESTPFNDFTSSFLSSRLDAHMGKEGFNGIFLFVAAKFADASLGAPSWESVENRNPDPASFEAIERLLSEIRSRGGGLHLWYAGECRYGQCPQDAFGNSGASTNGEKRLLRYIAARLGPLPGWIMGYGWDIGAHASEGDVTRWMSFLRDTMGWTHYLGARDQAGGGSPYTFVEESDFYSHGDYFNGVDNSTIQSLLGNGINKPHSFDERWWERRLRSEKAIARQLWTTYMAGGASSIVGPVSAPNTDDFDNPELFNTLFTFWEGRFLSPLTSDNTLTDGTALQDASSDRFIFYREETSSVEMDLSEASGPIQAVAVDTRGSYAEVDLGTLEATTQTIVLPYSSDWAIAVGSF